jgi:hypothetical protein
MDELKIETTEYIKGFFGVDSFGFSYYYLRGMSPEAQYEKILWHKYHVSA